METNKFKSRKIACICIVLVMAIIHYLRLGKYLSTELHVYYQSFASDIMVPFAFYFLFCIAEPQISLFLKWQYKAIIVFTLASFAEFAQLLGLKILGTTFDLVDILMYAIGTALAVLFDIFVLKKAIK